MEPSSPTLWTIGHSTHPLEEFIAILRAHRIETLADVRHFPGSRRHPHFGKEPLAAALREAGIGYVHFPALGGRRKPDPDSRNTAWRNESFRAYADYMETAPFASAIGELLQLAAHSRTAIMCAEAVWWRCHRSLISDYLKSRGIEVLHILNPRKAESHPYTPAARIVAGKLTYHELL